MSHADVKRTALRTFFEGAQVGIDYETVIGLGGMPGHKRFRALGRRTALATTVGGDDIWEGAAVAFVYPDQSVGEQMTLVSSSDNDIDTTGSGVRIVAIHYLDASGNPLIETVALSGTTPVHTTATNIRFVQNIHSATVGSIGATAAGDIIIYRFGDAARIYNVIKTGGNISLNSQRMVPAGKTFSLTNILATAVDNKPISVRFRATCDHDGILTPGVFIYNEVFELYNSGVPIILKIPRIFPPLCILKGTAISTSVGGTCSLSYDGWIE